MRVPSATEMVKVPDYRSDVSALRCINILAATMLPGHSRCRSAGSDTRWASQKSRKLSTSFPVNDARSFLHIAEPYHPTLCSQRDDGHASKTTA